MQVKYIISKTTHHLFALRKSSSLRDQSLKANLLKEQNEYLFFANNQTELWRRLKNNFSETEIKRLKNNFVTSQNDFEKEWQILFQQLQIWKIYFQKNNHILKKILLHFAALTHNNLRSINVFLLVNDSKDLHAWFSWTETETFIVLEIPKQADAHGLFPISVLGHEILHILLRKKKKFNQLIAATARDNQLEKMFFEELVVSSFLPEGYLSHLCCNTTIPDNAQKPQDLLSWRRYVAKYMANITKEYIESARKLDQHYLDAVIKVNRTMQ